MIRHNGQPIPVPAHHLFDFLYRPEHRSAKYIIHRMKLVFERGYNTEITSPAAQGPKKIGMLVFVSGNQATVCQHDISTDKIIDRQAVLSAEIPVAAPESQSPYSRGRDSPADGGKSQFVCCVIHIAPGTARFRAHRFSLRIHPD